MCHARLRRKRQVPMLPFGSSGMISFTRSCVTASLFAHVTKSLITRRSDWAVGGAGLAGLGLGGGAVAAFEAGPEPNRPDPNGDFADTAVLITGATSGIGHATAIAFANRGAKVFFCGRRNELGLANQDQIRLMGGDATFHRADVREEGQVRDSSSPHVSTATAESMWRSTTPGSKPLAPRQYTNSPSRTGTTCSAPIRAGCSCR